MLILALHKKKNLVQVSIMRDGNIIARGEALGLKEAIESSLKQTKISIDEVDHIGISKNKAGGIAGTISNFLRKCFGKRNYTKRLEELLLCSGKTGRWNRRFFYYSEKEAENSIPDGGCFIFWCKILKRQKIHPHPALVKGLSI